MKQEVRRGRKFIEYHDPDTQDANTFTQEISGADVSYQDESGNWLPADENWATDGVDGFILKNDKLNHKVRLKGKGGRTWYPRRNVNTEYMTFGVPQYWNGKRWANFGFSGWSVEGKTITLNTRKNVTILVHNRWNGIKIDWILASSSAPSRMRYPVALTGITYVDGIIYGADGTRLGQLTPTTATDANGAELVCSGSFASGYVEFQADVTGASFPVTIDPDFTASAACYSVAGSSLSSDYSEARSTSANFRDYSDLTYATKGIGQLYDGLSSYDVQRMFLKFDTSSISSGSTVTDVTFSGALQANYAGDAFDVQVVMQNWSGQDPITDDNRETAFDGCLAGTSAGVWINTGTSKTRRIKYTSESLNTALVTVAGTTYLSLRSSLDYAGTAPDSDDQISIFTANEATYQKPILTITYEAGTPTGVPKHFLHYARLRSN